MNCVMEQLKTQTTHQNPTLKEKAHSTVHVLLKLLKPVFSHQQDGAASHWAPDVRKQTEGRPRVTEHRTRWMAASLQRRPYLHHPCAERIQQAGTAER